MIESSKSFLLFLSFVLIVVLCATVGASFVWTMDFMGQTKRDVLESFQTSTMAEDSAMNDPSWKPTTLSQRKERQETFFPLSTYTQWKATTNLMEIILVDSQFNGGRLPSSTVIPIPSRYSVVSVPSSAAAKNKYCLEEKLVTRSSDRRSFELSFPVFQKHWKEGGAAAASEVGDFSSLRAGHSYAFHVLVGYRKSAKGTTRELLLNATTTPTFRFEIPEWKYVLDVPVLFRMLLDEADDDDSRDTSITWMRCECYLTLPDVGKASTYSLRWHLTDPFRSHRTQVSEHDELNFSTSSSSAALVLDKEEILLYTDLFLTKLFPSVPTFPDTFRVSCFLSAMSLNVADRTWKDLSNPFPAEKLSSATSAVSLHKNVSISSVVSPFHELGHIFTSSEPIGNPLLFTMKMSDLCRVRSIQSLQMWTITFLLTLLPEEKETEQLSCVLKLVAGPFALDVHTIRADNTLVVTFPSAVSSSSSSPSSSVVLTAVCELNDLNMYTLSIEKQQNANYHCVLFRNGTNANKPSMTDNVITTGTSQTVVNTDDTDDTYDKLETFCADNRVLSCLLVHSRLVKPAELEVLRRFLMDDCMKETNNATLPFVVYSFALHSTEKDSSERFSRLVDAVLEEMMHDPVVLAGVKSDTYVVSTRFHNKFLARVAVYERRIRRLEAQFLTADADSPSSSSSTDAMFQESLLKAAKRIVQLKTDFITLSSLSPQAMTRMSPHQRMRVLDDTCSFERFST